jgi:hypothetical protein
MMSKVDPLSLLTSMSQLCALVPQTNSTEALLVGGMSKFIGVVTGTVLPAAGNNTDVAAAAVNVLGALGVAASSSGFDLSKSFSLSSMLTVVSSFSSFLSLAKSFKLL